MKTIDMKKRLKRTVIFAVALTIFLFISGYVVARLFVVTFNSTTEDRMYEEARNYRGRINREVDQNFQLLNTVASLVGSYDLENVDGFEEALMNADAQNDFLIFGYFDKEGEGLISGYRKSGPLRVHLSQLQTEIQDVVAGTMRGEEVVSDAFMGDITKENVFVFGVPVYRNGELIGALMASDAVDIFTDVLEERNWFYGSGYVHLLNSQGDYIIRNQERVVKENLKSIMNPPYLTEEESQEVYNLMQREERVEFSFLYHGMEYQALLEPVGINGWYLICINSLENVNRNIYQIAYAAAGFFIAITVLFSFLLISEYHTMKNVNEQLMDMAYYDDLTGLYNMKRFMDLVEEACEEDENFSVAAINIRQFKFINEIFGKDQANRLLAYIGKVLRKNLGEDEFACRESADMFYVCLRDTEEQYMQERMEWLLQAIVHDSRERGTYQLGVRGGIAKMEPGLDPQEVVTHAMFALAKAKKMYQSGYHVFDQTLHEQEQMDNYMESHAREALREGEFQLYLQPKVDLKKGKVAGAEALVRWVKEDKTVLYPGSFIPLFEANGFCAQLDLYMFEKVCQQLRAWMDAGIEPIPISINQSKATFYEEEYENRLCDIMRMYNVPSRLITLEILEGLVIDDLQEMNRRLEHLRQLGFKISMDDFGTGYSSLNTLGKLKIDEVKLDRGFLLEAVEGTDRKVRLIMEEIVHLSKKLSIDTVIEGIETEENEQFVKEINCDYGQGYWFSRPLDVDTFTKDFLVNRK